MLSPLVFGQQKNDDGIRLHCKLLTDGHATKIVRPTYPELARQTHVDGRVSLACIIGRDGSVQKIEVMKGHPLLIQAATDAVAQWRFKPIVLNGQAVEMETTVNIDFQLPNPEVRLRDLSGPPMAQAQKPHTLRVEEDVQKAKLVHMVYAVYPPVLGKRMDGTVVLRVIVGKNGSVKSARPASGLPNLRDSAVNAVLQWQYKPTFVNGVAVEVDTTVTLVFPSPEKLGPPFANK
jgi:TonB family protein